MTNFFYSLGFLPIEFITEFVEDFKEFYDVGPLQYADSGIKSGYTYGKNRIEIGNDCGTCQLCVDLDPAVDGIYGQVILVDYESGVAFTLADSIQSMVKVFENDLIAGKYALDEEAADNGDQFLEPSRDIDVVNWRKSSRWEYITEKLR